jgi:hypothetical protein
VEPKYIAIAGHGHGLGKHLFAPTNAQATIEELLEEIFSMWSSLRLYNKDQ